MSSIQLQDRNNWCCSVVRITIESMCVLPAGPLSPHGSKDPHSILIPVHVTCQRALQITPGFREPSTVNRQWRHVKDCRSAHLQFRLRLRALETGEREGQSKPRLREGKRPGGFPPARLGRTAGAVVAKPRKGPYDLAGLLRGQMPLAMTGGPGPLAMTPGQMPLAMTGGQRPPAMTPGQAPRKASSIASRASGAFRPGS